MIVVDGSALAAYLGGDPVPAAALDAAAGEIWLMGPLAVAEVLAPAAAHSPEALARVQHALHDLGINEVDLTSHAGAILGRLLGECADLGPAQAATLQLALERDAAVLTVDDRLREACLSRGLTVI